MVGRVARERSGPEAARAAEASLQTVVRAARLVASHHGTCPPIVQLRVNEEICDPWPSVLRAATLSEAEQPQVYTDRRAFLRHGWMDLLHAPPPGSLERAVTSAVSSSKARDRTLDEWYEDYAEWYLININAWRKEVVDGRIRWTVGRTAGRG